MNSFNLFRNSEWDLHVRDPVLPRHRGHRSLRPDCRRDMDPHLVQPQGRLHLRVLLPQIQVKVSQTTDECYLYSQGMWRHIIKVDISGNQNSFFGVTCPILLPLFLVTFLPSSDPSFHLDFRWSRDLNPCSPLYQGASPTIQTICDTSLYVLLDLHF